jgi:hypothetical protein
MTVSTERRTPIAGANPQRVVHWEEMRISIDPYNPNVGFIRFLHKEWVEAGGNDVGVDSQSHGRVRRDFSVVKNEQPADAGATDPVTGADLTQISMRGVGIILADAFNQWWLSDNGFTSP